MECDEFKSLTWMKLKNVNFFLPMSSAKFFQATKNSEVPKKYQGKRHSANTRHHRHSSIRTLRCSIRGAPRREITYGSLPHVGRRRTGARRIMQTANRNKVQYWGRTRRIVRLDEPTTTPSTIPTSTGSPTRTCDHIPGQHVVHGATRQGTQHQ